MTTRDEDDGGDDDGDADLMVVETNSSKRPKCDASQGVAHVRWR